MSVGKTTAAEKSATGDQMAAGQPSDRPWYKQRHLLHLNFIIVSLVMYSSANGYDGSLMNGLEALNQWKTFMDNPAGAWLGWINAIYLLGCGIGYPIASWIANRYGRKRGVYVGYVFLVLGCVLQTAAHNDASFLLARFFLGGASALFGNAVPLLINEIAYPSQRSLVSGFFMCGWYVGGTVAAWVVFASRTYPSSWAWRLPSLLQVLVPLIGLPGFLLAPESPRWLVSAGREDEARAILVQYHAAGDTTSPVVHNEFEEILTAIRKEKQPACTGSYLEMFQTPGNRRRLLISLTLGITAQWCGNGVISYYLPTILTSVGVSEVRDQTLISACLQMWDLIFAGLGAYLIDRLGRRPMVLASSVTMLISYVLVTALSGSFASTNDTVIGGAVIPFLFTFFAGYCLALTPLLTSYPCEIWPYRLRSRGLTVTWLASICGMFFNTFVNPIALAAIQWRYYFVFMAVLIVFGVIAYLFYPETKGYALEQIAVLFDGPDWGGLGVSGRNDGDKSKARNAMTTHTESI
ncbi:Major facilitator superfamily domain general substrate transporter [Penicillium capsulatum]|uniref:Major facilitator superfamily domain general substrate transporter n=1 Tax=Penicillium capsulatum TaxID=69766 RepID=A0A9W9LQB1_9EURO|nr:Major facilitator superfamily domain general substrate transporter [Penicillium capsulatum]KAJ6136168.1 Major facilitator superfamily domain general substrate transporter [Penicillium capsulatum]